jgi:hypothetical protein
MTFSRSEPFCDWLDVTCSPDLSFHDDVVRFLDLGCYPVAFSDDSSTSFRVGEGILRLDTERKWHRASASGSVLSHFRAVGQYQAYLSALSGVPHTVTRLDAAVDTSQDFPPVLRALRRRYKDGQMAFGRKLLRITELLAVRLSDGASTGTWYAGHRSQAQVTARVYDKQNELLDKHGVDSAPRTRYELTFRRSVGATLRDASMPASLFYQHSQQLGLKPPGDVGPWQSHDLGGWSAVPLDSDFTVAHFTRRVETSPEIQHLAALAEQFGPNGRAMILRAFERALSSQLSLAAPESQDAA